MKTLQEAIEEYKKSPSFSLAADRVEEVHQKLAFEKGYYAGLEAANASERFRAEDAVAALAEENRLREQLSALQQENETQKKALAKINDIRNSIIGYQAINWSAHIYPLVAALAEAGIKGDDYEKCRGMAKTQIDRIKDLEQENEKLRKFKEYVHARLDQMGLPEDPEPENNAKHGCRIEGRLNLVGNLIYPNTAS